MHALLQSRLGVWVHELLDIKAGAAGALDKCKQSLFFEALGGCKCMYFLLLLSHDLLYHVQAGTRLREAE